MFIFLLIISFTLPQNVLSERILMPIIYSKVFFISVLKVAVINNSGIFVKVADFVDSDSLSTIKYLNNDSLRFSNL